MDEPTTFGQQLRRLRQQRGLSLRELAKRALHAKTLIGDRENGKRTPTADVAARLDQLLDGGGVLTAAAEQLATDNATPARLAHVAAAPRTVDAASVDALAGVLANMRRLEDSVGAGPLIAATAGQLKLLESLAEEARGPIRARVVDLAGQWAQFAGWLRAATGQPERARRWYARTLEHATEADNRDLIATALSMRGNLAWVARRADAVVELSAAAADRAGSPGVRAMAAQQQARGHALLGEAEHVDRLMDRAEAEMARAAQHPDAEPPWIYFYGPGYLQMQRGLAYRLLYRHGDAIAALTAGLAAADENVRTSEFVAAYVLYLAEEHLAVGDNDVAAVVLEQVRQVAQAKRSAKLVRDVARLERRLDR